MHSKQARLFGELVLESRDDWPVERGLDRHNLELYNRKKRDEDADQGSSSAEEKLEAEGGSEKGQKGNRTD